jgi:hypothetical protein
LLQQRTRLHDDVAGGEGAHLRRDGGAERLEADVIPGRVASGAKLRELSTRVQKAVFAFSAHRVRTPHQSYAAAPSSARAAAASPA